MRQNEKRKSKRINFNQLWHDYKKIENSLPQIVKEWAGKKERYDPYSNYTMYGARLLKLGIKRDSKTSDPVAINMGFAGPFAYDYQFIHRKICSIETSINLFSDSDIGWGIYCELDWHMLQISHDTVLFDEEKKKVIHCIYFRQGHISITCDDILCQFIANGNEPFNEEETELIDFDRLWHEYNKIENKLPEAVKKWAGREERYNPYSNYTMHDARLLKLGIKRDSNTSNPVAMNMVFAGPFAYDYQFKYRKICSIETTINLFSDIDQTNCSELDWGMLEVSYDKISFDEEKKKVIHCIYFHQGYISITCADIFCQFIANENEKTK